MLLLQLLTLAAGYVWLSEYNVILFGATSILSAVLVVVEVNRDEEPLFKLTWVILIAIIPVFGVLLYIYLHMDFLKYDIANAQEKVQSLIAPHIKNDEELINEVRARDAGEAGFLKYLSKRGGAAAYRNTSVKYYPLGDYIFTDMLAELEKAEKFIFLEFFIINQSGRFWPEILSILKRKVKEGVEVRMLYDGMGCMSTLPRGYCETMQAAGIKCRVFSPIQPLLSTYQNNRDHRKILVIDGKTAFSGGINLADEYANFIKRFGHWKDTGVMIQGDAVQNFTMIFLQMWNIGEEQPESYRPYLTPHILCRKAAGYVVPYADSPFDDENVGEHVYLDMLYTAKKYVHIMTPYLIIGYEMVQALTYAAKRGVEVELILPHIPDKWYAFQVARTYYEELLSAGVHIYEYTPGFIHAKSYVSDDEKAVVGSINMDYRSLYLHFECATLFFNNPAVEDVERDFQKTRAQSQRMTVEDYKNLPWYERLTGRVLRLIAPLM